MSSVQQVQAQAYRIREAFSRMPYMAGVIDTRVLNVSGHDADSPSKAAMAILKATADHVEALADIMERVTEKHKHLADEVDQYRLAVRGAAMLQRMVERAMVVEDKKGDRRDGAQGT